MQTRSIGFIGGGRITKVFLRAFANAGVTFEEVSVFDPNAELLLKLKEDFPQISTNSDSVETAGRCDLVILAVHPPVLMETLLQIRSCMTENAMVVSLAPKVTIEKIRVALEGRGIIARVNPNAIGIANQGMNAVVFSDAFTDKDKDSLISLLKILGKTVVVEEQKIEAYALISAMGPTYFAFQLQHLKRLGMSYGMDENEAKEAIKEMLRGTVDALFYSGMTLDGLMDLIPTKPLGEYEEQIKSFYTGKLDSLYQKIKP